MDPLGSTTATLLPAMSHITNTATAITATSRERQRISHHTVNPPSTSGTSERRTEVVVAGTERSDGVHHHHHHHQEGMGTAGPVDPQVQGSYANQTRTREIKEKDLGEGGGEQEKSKRADERRKVKERQRRLVGRVLNSPRRIRALIRAGHMEDAKHEWKETVQLLDRWKGVDGVEDVRREGQRALNEERLQ